MIAAKAIYLVTCVCFELHACYIHDGIYSILNRGKIVQLLATKNRVSAVFTHVMGFSYYITRVKFTARYFTKDVIIHIPRHIVGFLRNYAKKAIVP